VQYKIAQFAYWLLGWKWKQEVSADHKRMVLIAAPHTSNWDFFYAFFVFKLLRLPVRFTIKDTMMRFPLNLFFGSIGGIAIDRRARGLGEKRASAVDAMVDLFAKNDELALIVTAEGTRSLRTKWKTGFYHIAIKANVPIGLGYCNYITKEAGVGKIIYPSGDMAKDMREIMDFYKQYIGKGKHPELFSLDVDYI
jgi:1-acyl-sn-glycerol-3-phosphate acyltransferase